jgi:hypothetical protein
LGGDSHLRAVPRSIIAHAIARAWLHLGFHSLDSQSRQHVRRGPRRTPVAARPHPRDGFRQPNLSQATAVAHGGHFARFRSSNDSIQENWGCSKFDAGIANEFGRLQLEFVRRLTWTVKISKVSRFVIGAGGFGFW